MTRTDQKVKELEAQISKLRSSVEELRVLNDIAVSSGKAVNVDEILNLIVQKSITAAAAEQGSILLVTKNSKNPFRTMVRQDDTSSLRHNYHIGNDITGWVLHNKKPLIIEDLSNDGRFHPGEDEKKEIRSVLCVPIWFEGDITGLMMLVNKKNGKPFTKGDMTLFSIISVQAGQLIKNLELQRKSFQERKEAEKLQELDKLKTHFFTNISHEFRTPLTLILGPARQILGLNEINKVRELADVILKSGLKLKTLTDQILDLSKIEAGQVKLEAVKGNITKTVEDIVLSFQSLAESKEIHLQFKADEQITFCFDRDKVDKIISNLLSNAIKFTQRSGSVDVGIRVLTDSYNRRNEDNNSAGLLEITVEDNGKGIGENQLNRIFERYYQADETSGKYEGTGIGLALVKELVELHKGSIVVQSREGKGTKFRLRFPMGIEPSPCPAEKSSDIETKEAAAGGVPDDTYLVDRYKVTPVPASENRMDSELNIKGNPVLLIIEDNENLRKYTAGILEDYYKIIQAENGKSGLAKSFEIIPDLVISDIMMPEMDGISLLRELKSDVRTSHIPLILLTARSAVSDKINGLDSGADDYIIKPFEAWELKARVRNLLGQRKRIHEHFRAKGILLDDTRLTSIDQKFLQDAVMIINKHISDFSFSVQSLAGELAVSRSILHRKLDSLIGESPSDLIRRLRLNKAAKLIEQKWGNMAEVSLEVGFNNPSYFSKCFQKQFGFQPSQYHQKKI